MSSRLCLFCTFEEGDIPGYLLTEIHIRTLAGDFDIFILISHDNILSVKTDDPVVAAQIKNVRTVNVVFIYNARRYLFRHLVSSALSFGTSLHYAIIALLIIYLQLLYPFFAGSFCYSRQPFIIVRSEGYIAILPQRVAFTAKSAGTFICKHKLTVIRPSKSSHVGNGSVEGSLI